MSRLVAHQRIFRLHMRWKFDPYVLWPLAKRVQNWIVGHSTASHVTVCPQRGVLLSFWLCALNTTGRVSFCYSTSWNSLHNNEFWQWGGSNYHFSKLFQHQCLRPLSHLALPQGFLILNIDWTPRLNQQTRQNLVYTTWIQPGNSEKNTA